MCFIATKICNIYMPVTLIAVTLIGTGDTKQQAYLAFEGWRFKKRVHLFESYSRILQKRMKHESVKGMLLLGNSPSIQKSHLTFRVWTACSHYRRQAFSQSFPNIPNVSKKWISVAQGDLSRSHPNPTSSETVSTLAPL